jgi:hypothetical protein
MTVRDAAILTTSYVAGTVIGLDSEDSIHQLHVKNQLVLKVDFTIGSLTSVEIKIEYSHDNSDYYQFTYVGAPSTGASAATPFVLQLTATGKCEIPIPIKSRYIKVSAKGTGTVTNSSLKILAVAGIA